MPERNAAERRKRRNNKAGSVKVNSGTLITLGLTDIGLSILGFNEYHTRINNIPLLLKVELAPHLIIFNINFR